ncbi:MAG TPA: LuxR family transcriptional regulator [Rhizobiales bacterium]|nr:LuxR family transcriptional regulator [Hyphomicrobiales bacterium]
MNALARRRNLPEIVEAVYDSVADPALWQSTLGSICEACEGRLAMLAVVDTDGGTLRMSETCGDPALLRPLMSDYGSKVPFYAALPKMEIDVPFTVDSVYALQGPGTRQAWLDSRIAREWVVPNRLDDFFWVALMKRPSRVGSLMVVTDKDRRPITTEDIDVVALLAPHVRRAVMISDLFESERRATALFRTIVDHLGVPIVIVGEDCHVLYANPAAEAVLAEGGIAAAPRGRLQFRYSHANAAIARAVALGVRDEFALGPAGIDVPLAGAPVAAVAHVLPLARRDPSSRISSRAAAAVFVAAQGASPQPAIDAIGALFGLTAAEKRVAAKVAAGLTRGEIALSTGVSDGTVKSQLAAVFDKTGTGDQRQLELLLRELSPPVLPRTGGGRGG